MLFIITIGLIISMSKIDKLNEDNTTLFTATVKSVDVIDTGDEIFAKIYVNEYDTCLQISTNICKYIEIDDICKLKNGQTIFFRIENIKVKQVNKVDFLNIVSLKTNIQNIYSLGEYNNYICESAYPTRIISTTMALVFLFVSVLYFVKAKKIYKAPQ